jgi:hypothetical protein
MEKKQKLQRRLPPKRLLPARRAFVLMNGRFLDGERPFCFWSLKENPREFTRMQIVAVLRLRECFAARNTHFAQEGRGMVVLPRRNSRSSCDRMSHNPAATAAVHVMVIKASALRSAIRLLLSAIEEATL